MKSAIKLLFLGASLVVSACQTPVEDDGPQVIATLFPQYSIANELVGDLVDVTFLLEDGGSIHGYEPTPSQIIALNTASVVLYSGEIVEPWMHAIEETASGQLIDVSTGITLIEGHDHEEEETSEEHEHGDEDPHYWIDPANGLIMLETIATSLKALLPEESALIETRRSTLENAFLEVVEAYESLIPENEELDVVFAGHNVFGYLETYHLHVLSPYAGFSDDVLPTAESLTSFISLIESLNTNILYYSSLDSVVVVDALVEAYPEIELVELYSIASVPSDMTLSTTYQEFLSLNLEAISLSYAS